MTILVTGGTGTIGRRVVQGLLQRGADVRAMARRAPDPVVNHGAQHVWGDMTDPALDSGVLDGVRSVFLFPAEGDLGPFLRQAAVGGAEHVVVLSSLAAAQEHERDRTSVSSRHHRAVEEAVAASGIPATILRPGTFATNLLFWANAIRYSCGVDGPYSTSAQAPIHEADIADVAVTALLDPAAHSGRTYALTGPQALTQADQLAAIAEAIGRPLTYRTVTPEEYTATMTQWMPADVVAMLVRYWRETVDEPDVVRSSASITGRARTLAEWAVDHADAFR